MMERYVRCLPISTVWHSSTLTLSFPSYMNT
uniref:Uncharacterized protein n=1 Tax=Anguilla anguilla TaxID=7936 RepID=A0A0E9S3G3_ANGAN